MIWFEEIVYITSKTEDCLCFMSDNINHSCCLTMLHPYAVKFIVGIVCTGFTRFIDLISKTGCDATWDYIITGNAYTKMQGWWCFRPPLWILVLKDKLVQYWLCSKLWKKMLNNYLHVHILQGNTMHDNEHVGITETWISRVQWYSLCSNECRVV